MSTYTHIVFVKRLFGEIGQVGYFPKVTRTARPDCKKQQVFSYSGDYNLHLHP